MKNNISKYYFKKYFKFTGDKICMYNKKIELFDIFNERFAWTDSIDPTIINDLFRRINKKAWLCIFLVLNVHKYYVIVYNFLYFNSF